MGLIFVSGKGKKYAAGGGAAAASLPHMPGSGGSDSGVIKVIHGRIGETGLLRMFPARHQTGLTIIIPDPKMQNKGCGTEAVRIMLDMAFHCA